MLAMYGLHCTISFTSYETLAPTRDLSTRWCWTNEKENTKYGPTLHVFAGTWCLLLWSNKAPDASSVTKVGPVQNDTSPWWSMSPQEGLVSHMVEWGGFKWRLCSHAAPRASCLSIHAPKRHQPASTACWSLTDGCLVLLHCNALHQTVVPVQPRYSVA